MLKTFFTIVFLLTSFTALACWKVEGQFAVDGQTWPIHQKIDHDKTYSLPMGTFILDLSLHAQKNGTNILKYSVKEKQGLKLTQITKGEEEIAASKKRDIFAKGEEGRPNSILTIKIDQI